MSLEVGGANHQGAVKRYPVCQFNENIVENTKFAPPDEPIVQRLVWVVFIRSILPLKPVLDNVNCHRRGE